MTENQPASEGQQSFELGFEQRLNMLIAWVKEDLRLGIPGAENLHGQFENGRSVDDILRIIKSVAEAGKPASLMILGMGGFHSTAPYIDTIQKGLPPLVREQGFHPEEVKKLADKLGLLHRQVPETVVFKADLGGINPHRILEGEEDYAAYNSLPITSSLVPPHTYWHELLQDFAYAGVTANVIITVNQEFHPAGTHNNLLKRLLGRLHI